MYVKQLFENKTVSKVVIITLASLYVLSILTCTVSFFTPSWLQDVTRIEGYGPRLFVYLNEYFRRTCNTLGLVSGDCRFPYSYDLDVLNDYYYTYSVTDRSFSDMRRTFYCMVITMGILYSNLAMTICAFFFNLLDNRIYVAALSIAYGVLYPLGAILVLIATIALEVKNPSNIGYSTILGNVSAGLMVLFYVGLRFYDDQCRKYRLKHVGGVLMDRVKAEHYN